MADIADTNPFLQEKFHSIEEKLKTMNEEELKENLYTALSFLCQVWTAFKEGREQKGWTNSLRTDADLPVFSPEDQAKLEEAMQGLSLVKGEQGGQSGGGMTGDDVSLDAAFERLLGTFDKYDQLWAQISHENPGLYKITQGSTMVPFPPYEISNSLIYTFITGVLEVIRYFLAVSPTDFKMLRYVTTLLIILDDAISGNWRQMILSSLGFFSQMGVFIGVTGRIVLSAWLFMNPHLRTNIAFDLYKGFKSVLVGFLFWAFVTVAPGSVKFAIDQGLARVRSVAGDLESRIETLKASANPRLQPMGYELRVKLDLETLQKISLADVQNLQTLATWGNFICASEIQGLIKPLANDPVFRVILELLGVPVAATELKKICGPTLGKSLADVLKDQIEVVPLASPALGPASILGAVQRGGGTASARRLKRARNYRRTRRRLRL